MGQLLVYLKMDQIISTKIKDVISNQQCNFSFIFIQKLQKFICEFRNPIKFWKILIHLMSILRTIL